MREIIYNYEPLWGNWYVKECVGSGSSGKVYKVVRKVFEKEYISAVKVITISGNGEGVSINDTDKTALKRYNESLIKSIVKEIDLLYELKANGNIIAYEDHIIQETDEGWHVFIRMEYAQSLKDYISQKGNLKLEEITKLGIDICNALAFCHSNGVIHRDIKEANIFVSKEKNVYKLGDFSVSRELTELACANTRVGTVNYMPPEVFKGEKYTKNADIYSLGIMLYKILNNGRMPFMPKYPNEFTATDVEKAQLKRMAGNKLEKPINGMPELDRIILKACAYKQSERYQVVNEMKSDLIGYYNTCNKNSFVNVDSRVEENTFQETVSLSDGKNSGETTHSSIREGDGTIGIFDNKRKRKINKTKLSLIAGLVVVLSTVGVLTFSGFIKFNEIPKLFKGKGVKPTAIAAMTTNFKSEDAKILVSPTITATDLKTLLTPSVKSTSSSTPKQMPKQTPVKESIKTTGVNLLKNGSCETKGSDWIELNSNGVDKAELSFTDEAKKSGIYSLRMIKPTTGNGCSYYQKIDIVKGKKYLISGYIRTNSVSNIRVSSTRGNGAQLKVQYRESAEKYTDIDTTGLIGTNGWTEKECIVEIPANAYQETITVYCYLDRALGTVYFDDIKLEEIVN